MKIFIAIILTIALNLALRMLEKISIETIMKLTLVLASSVLLMYLYKILEGV